MRVHEYAKENELTSKEVVQIANDLGIEVSNHMCHLEKEDINKLDQAFGITEEVISKPKKKKKKANKKKTKSVKEERISNVPVVNDDEGNVVYYKEGITVSEIAEALNKPVTAVIKDLMGLGMMATANQTVDRDTVELIVTESGYELKDEVETDITKFEDIVIEDNEEDLVERPPVVTIMGHVDHGKTTLLDAIRNSRVVSGEAGGITQHIGAYQVEKDGRKITFLDTPGHAAFTAMRARGAQVTDIIILVVASDDGVMPQTVEAIDHAKAAGVPIIVAVNKMDKPSANPDRVMQELSEYNLLPEKWGGDTIFVEMSALKGDGIEECLEMIQLVTEMEELNANPKRLATGTVVEAKLDKNRGPVATLLVQNGTLKVGDSYVVGTTHGRVRAMVNDLNQKVNEAGPSTPVEIIGLDNVPQAGDHFMVFRSDKEARNVADTRAVREKHIEHTASKAVTLDDLFSQIQEGDIKELNIIVKGDVQGSVEALCGSLYKLEIDGVKINIIRSSVGTITETDVTLAAASNAIIIGFNVRPDAVTRDYARTEGVDIRLHNIIYKVTEEIEAAMKGLLDPVFEEQVSGQVEVRETFKVSRVGTIAGCMVTDGKVTRNSSVRVIRNGIVVYEGKLSSLKRFKDDAKEVNQGYECGLTVENYNDIKIGDIIEAYEMIEKERE